MWNQYYGIIKVANSALESLDSYAANATTDAQKTTNRSYQGEVKFLRAYAYYRLVQAFGPVTILRDNTQTNLTRSTVAAVNRYMLEDLNYAIQNCPKVRPNEMAHIGAVSAYSAEALAAKVYLNMGQYDKVEELTDDIINSQKFELYGDFYQLFKIPGKLCDESLFECQCTDFGQGSGELVDVDQWFNFQGPSISGLSSQGQQISSSGWGFMGYTDEFRQWAENRGEQVRATTTFLVGGTTTPSGDQVKKQTNPLRTNCWNGKAYTLLAGYTLLFAITELLSLTMIFTKQPLHVLTVTYGVVAGVLAFLGARSLYKKRQKNRISPELVVAGILILIQLIVVVLYAHMDEDDAFYVGTATTAVETDSLYAYNPYTGAAYNVLPSRYILSPFPAFLAVTSRLCGGLHPAIVAHTVFPAVFVFLAYVVLFQYSRIFFKGKAGEQGIFMILCAVILWFCGYSVYNSEIFTMGRIWQGKAVLAGVFLPFLFLLCMEIFMQEKPEYPWSLAFLANGACCLFSSMGIMLAPLLMGVFALLSLVKFRDGRRFLKSVVCCLPSLILGVVYILVF